MSPVFVTVGLGFGWRMCMSEDKSGRLRVPSSEELSNGDWVEIGVVVGMLQVNWPQGFWGQVYCSHWNLAAVLYGWKVGLVWLLCVSAGCISGVLGVGFLGTWVLFLCLWMGLGSVKLRKCGVGTTE